MGLAKEMGIKQIKILSDFHLVVNQMNSTYQARDLKTTTYLKKALKLKEGFEKIHIEQILRDKNSHADALANLGSAVQVTESKKILIIYLKWHAV